MTSPLCGQPHYRYPETLCAEPAGHYVRDRDPHAGPLIIDGRQRGAAAWDEPKDTMPDRHTVDSITSDALDALYERLERAEDTLFRAREVARWMRRNYPGLRLANDTLATALDGEQPAPATAATGAIGYCPACGRGDVAPSPEEYEQQRQRAEQAAAALVRVQHVAALIHAGAPWTANRHDTAARIRAAIAGPGTAATEATGATGATGHRYLSTGCLHGEHGYCQAKTGQSGTKKPAVCKWCDASCRCGCHRDAMHQVSSSAAPSSGEPGA